MASIRTELHFMYAPIAGFSVRVSVLPWNSCCGRRARIEEVDRAVNACSDRLFDQAMEEARIAESRYL